MTRGEEDHTEELKTKFHTKSQTRTRSGDANHTRNCPRKEIPVDETHIYKSTNTNKKGHGVSCKETGLQRAHSNFHHMHVTRIEFKIHSHETWQKPVLIAERSVSRESTSRHLRKSLLKQWQQKHEENTGAHHIPVARVRATRRSGWQKELFRSCRIKYAHARGSACGSRHLSEGYADRVEPEWNSRPTEFTLHWAMISCHTQTFHCY